MNIKKINHKLKTIVGLVGFFFSGNILAHPVSFEGATMTTFETSDRRMEFMGTYSFTEKNSVGISYWEDFVDWKRGSFFQFSWLPKKWNLSNSQANFYLTAGLGQIETIDGPALAQKIEAQADWESRRYYGMIKKTGYFSSGYNEDFTSFKIGFAPYLANFDELSSWIIFDISRRNEETIWGPQLRFFYRNLLWEIGTKSDKSLLLNFMINF